MSATYTPELKRWTPARWCWALFAAGFIIRFAYALSVDRESAFGGWDGKEYHAYAQQLLTFKGDDYPRFFNTIRAAGYPIFLMPFVRLSKTAVWPIQFAQCLLGLVQIYVLAKIAGRIAGQRAGNWAAIIATFHPFLIYFCAFVLTECLFITLLWTGIAGLQRAALRQKVTRWVTWAGVALGLACLVRPALQPFLIVAAGWLAWVMWRQSGRQIALARVILFTLIVSNILLPWMLGNLAVHREFTLSPGGAALVYAQSNSHEYLQTYRAKTKEEYYRALTQLHQRFAIKDGTLPATWGAEAKSFREEHREDWRQLQLFKVRHFWTPWLNPLIFSRPLFWASALSATPLFLAGLLELARRLWRRDGFAFLLLGLLLAGFLVGGLLFHVQIRYRIPFVDVAFIVLSAAALGTLFVPRKVPEVKA